MMNGANYLLSMLQSSAEMSAIIYSNSQLLKKKDVKNKFQRNGGKGKKKLVLTNMRSCTVSNALSPARSSKSPAIFTERKTKIFRVAANLIIYVPVI